MLLCLIASNSRGDLVNASDNYTKDWEVKEIQNMTSYNHDAIAAIKSTEQGVSGGMLSHLWSISGTITNIDSSNDVITVKVDNKSDYS